jgi:MFS family permease
MANIVMQPCDSGVVRWGTAASPCAKSSQPYVLAVTILGSSMVFIDGTVVNVALPALQADMDASVAEVQWVVESYALLLAALLLVGGALGDKHGRKRIFSAGVALFALASVWCGFAPDIEQLIVARAAQGLGGALLVPGSLAIIGASFSAEERGRAIGPAIAAIGFALFILPGVGGSYWATFFPAVVVLGIGMAVSVAPLTTTVMNAVGERRAGIASGINNAVARTAGLLAIAVLGLALQHGFNRALDPRLSALDLSPEARHTVDSQRTKLAGADFGDHFAPETRTVLRHATNESFVAGFRQVMAIAALLALLGALSGWLLIQRKGGGSEPQRSPIL